MALMRKIAAQAYRTFCKGHKSHTATEVTFNQNLSKLRDLLRRLTAKDLNFDESLVRDGNKFDPASGLAPVTYIDIWRDESFSMGIFVLKPGTRLPMHDHPDMYGLIRVIQGCLNVWSYTLLDENGKPFTHPLQVSHYNQQQQHSSIFRPSPVVGQIFSARLLSDASSGDRVDIHHESLMLTPVEGNIHEMKAIEGPAAFFDILAPPYDDLPSGYRQCNYYRELPVLGMSSDDVGGTNKVNAVRRLVCIPPPDDYWTDSAMYSGPDFDPYDRNIAV